VTLSKDSPSVSIVIERTKDEQGFSTFVGKLGLQTFGDYELVESTETARGKYLAFAHPDQEWEPTKLEKQVALLTKCGLNWCYCGAVPWAYRLQEGRVLRALLMGNFIPPGSVVMLHDLFLAVGGFSESEEMRGNVEWDLWLRLAALNPIGLVNEPLLTVGLPGVSSKGERAVVEAAVLRNEMELMDLRSEALAEICLSAGIAHLQADRRDEARADFAEALTHSPLRADAYLNWASSFLPSEAQQQIRDLHNLSRFTQRVEKKELVER
jgi:hypothetical protein